MQINIKANFSTLGFKVSCKMILSLLIAVTKHSQNTQSNKFAISLQYFKKRSFGWSSFFACIQIFYNLAWSNLMEVVRHVQSTQNRKLVIFLQYKRKKVSELLLCSTAMQNIQIFYRGPVMFVVICCTPIDQLDHWNYCSVMIDFPKISHLPLFSKWFAFFLFSCLLGTQN